MADNSLMKKLRKRFKSRGRDLAQSGTQDSSPERGAVASATSSQANTVSLSEQVSSSTITIALAHSDTASCTPLNISGKAVAEISQNGRGYQAADNIEDLATDGFLWDRAYDTLKEKEPDRIALYEDLLSRVLIRAQIQAPPAPNETEDAGEVTDQIPQHDNIARREKLKEIIKLGLEYIKDKKVSTTLLGHEIVLQDVVANVAGVVEWTEDYIKDAVKDLPFTSTMLLQSYAGKRRFAGVNALVALSNTVTSILRDPCLQNTYLIIDALDECTTDLNLFLDLIQNSLAYSSVKWIVSSRNWPSIEKGLNQAMQKVTLHLELNETSVSAAVTTYIQFKVEWLAKQNEYEISTRDAVQRYLSSNVKGTFLWVALVCQELADISGWKAEEVLIEFPPGLDALYKRMMDQICKSRNARLCKSILAVVSLVYRPITLDELASFFDMPTQSSGNYKVLAEIIELCGSFLTLQERIISFVHQSAKEFLIEKASKEIFLYGIEDEHHTVFLRSLQVMSKTLCRDIYGLKAPGVSIDHVKQPNPDPLAAARYSCVYWIDHLLDCDTRTNSDLKDGGLVDEFLCQSYLYWLEALSLMRSLSSGVVMIKKLENWLKADKSPDLYAFIHDAKRFLLYNRSLIKEAPLQIYCSALVFAPGKSIVRRRFEEYVPPWIQRKPIVQADWSAALQMLEGHLSKVNSVAFSPDGMQIVSGSIDKTVRLWDAVTGAALQTLEGHSGCVTSVAFSPDGMQVVSGSEDKTVQLWDAVTGLALHRLQGHLWGVNSVAFSPDSKQVVSGSDDQTVRLWDAVTSAALQTLEGHLGCVTSVAFSPNGKLVMSGSFDTTVRVWDAMTGSMLQMLEGHLSWVNSVAFSPDGKQVLFGSEDGTVQLWDAVIGSALQRLKGHSDAVNSVAFSPDSKQVVSGSQDKTMRVWDMVTGSTMQTLKGHSGCVTSVAFSPHGKLVMSGSDDKTVRLWDVATEAALQLEDHSSRSHSPDGKQVVSGSNDKTARLWDPTTGAALETLERHLRPVSSVAFSPDGNQVVSGSEGGTMRLWDMATGPALATVKCQFYSVTSVTSVAFSPNSKQVVCGLEDGEVRLWDVVTGSALQTLESHLSVVNSVAFSPDGKQVISGSNDKTVRLWDVATGSALQTLRGRSGWVTSVAFSPDGKQVVSASDWRVWLWDVVTGAELKMFTCGSHIVNSVAFLPDGKKVVSRSLDSTVWLWDTVTGAALQTLEGGSPDGKLLHTLLVSNNWIVEGGINILWLPLSHRPACWAVWNEFIVLGHSSGRLFILGFKEGSKLI